MTMTGSLIVSNAEVDLEDFRGTIPRDNVGLNLLQLRQGV